MKRKLLSLVLAFCMTLSLVPAASAHWVTNEEGTKPADAKFKVEYFKPGEETVVATRYFNNKGNDDWGGSEQATGDHLWDPITVMGDHEELKGCTKAVVTLFADITLEDTTILVDKQHDVTITSEGDTAHTIKCTLDGTIEAGEGGAHKPGMDAISIASDNEGNALTLDKVKVAISGPTAAAAAGEGTTNATQGIYNDGTLTLQNGAEVTVNGVSQNGVNGSGTLAVQGAGTKLSVASVGGSGVKGGNVTVSEGASVSVTEAAYHGITATKDGGVTITGNSSVSVSGSAANKGVALQSAGKLTITNSTLTLTDTQEEAPAGTETQTSGYDVAVASAGAAISGATVTGDLRVASGDATVDGSAVTGDITNAGTGAVSVTGETTTVTGNVSNTSTGSVAVTQAKVEGSVSNTSTGALTVVGATVTGQVQNTGNGPCAVVGSTVNGSTEDNLSGLDETADKALISALNWKNKFPELLGNDAGKENLSWADIITAAYWTGEAETAGQTAKEEKKAIYDALLKEIKAYYAEIEALDMSGKKIADSKFEGANTGCLVMFTGLTSLNLSDTGITEIGGLAPDEDKGLTGMTKLETLDLSNNPGMKDTDDTKVLGALKDLTKLKELDLSGCTGISDLGGLSTLTSLEELNLSNNTGIKDAANAKVLGALENLTQLKKLDLNGCTGIYDLGGIKKANSLESLDISNTGMKDFNFMWNETEPGSPRYGSLKNLQAKNLKDLTSIDGLANVAKASGFSAAGVTWNLSGSKIENADEDIKAIKDAFAKTGGSFSAPNDPIYTITLDANGGTVSPSTLVTNSNGKLPGGSLPTPTRSGSYRFDGWYTDKSSGDKVDSNTVFTRNATIYAHWTYTGGGSSGGGSSSGGGGGGGGAVVTKYTLTFDTNGGSAITKVTKDKGTKVDLSGYTTTRQGYTFSGWYADKALTDKVTSVTLNSNQTVYAKWTEKTPEKPALPFTDVTKGDWFYDAVQYVYDKGMMNGVDGGRFAPNAATSRAMIVTILYRLENEPAVSGKSPFTDVAAGQWYTNAVAWAAANGIVTGTTDTTFAPNGNITREQMAAILYRYASYKGLDVSRQADLSGYADANAISAYAKQAMAWANGQGLITGVTATTLRPDGNAVRAQAATILMRLCEQVL